MAGQRDDALGAVSGGLNGLSHKGFAGSQISVLLGLAPRSQIRSYRSAEKIALLKSHYLNMNLPQARDSIRAS